MIAPSSLSAFAPSVKQPTRVAATPASRADAGTAAQKTLQLPPLQTAPSRRVAPRGSLLDLSV